MLTGTDARGRVVLLTTGGMGYGGGGWWRCGVEVGRLDVGFGLDDGEPHANFDGCFDGGSCQSAFFLGSILWCGAEERGGYTADRRTAYL